MHCKRKKVFFLLNYTYQKKINETNTYMNSTILYKMPMSNAEFIKLKLGDEHSAVSSTFCQQLRMLKLAIC